MYDDAYFIFKLLFSSFVAPPSFIDYPPPDHHHHHRHHHDKPSNLHSRATAFPLLILVKFAHRWNIKFIICENKRKSGGGATRSLPRCLHFPHTHTHGYLILYTRTYECTCIEQPRRKNKNGDHRTWPQTSDSARVIRPHTASATRRRRWLLALSFKYYFHFPSAWQLAMKGSTRRCWRNGQVAREMDVAGWGEGAAGCHLLLLKSLFHSRSPSAFLPPPSPVGGAADHPLPRFGRIYAF